MAWQKGVQNKNPSPQSPRWYPIISMTGCRGFKKRFFWLLHFGTMWNHWAWMSCCVLCSAEFPPAARQRVKLEICWSNSLRSWTTNCPRAPTPQATSAWCPETTSLTGQGPTVQPLSNWSPVQLPGVNCNGNDNLIWYPEPVVQLYLISIKFQFPYPYS